MEPTKLATPISATDSIAIFQIQYSFYESLTTGFGQAEGPRLRTWELVGGRVAIRAVCSFW
jgi:hypothetical protein